MGSFFDKINLMGDNMPRAFTKPEQNKLLENPYIIHVSSRRIKFDKKVLEQITATCKSIPDIRNLLSQLGIPQIALSNSRVNKLYMRYVYKGGSARSKMPRKYFNDQEIKQLNKLDVVSKVTSSTITYSADFKVQISNCKTLTEARKLMNKNNVPLDVIGERRFENSYYRLRDQKKKKGDASFSSEQRGRKPSTNVASYQNLTDSEKVAILEKRLNERDEEVEFLKKYMPSLQSLRISPKEWYEAIMLACKDGNGVPYRLCKAAGVDPSGYYHHINRVNNKSEKIIRDDLILADIQYIQKMHKQTKGYRQITMELNIFYATMELPNVNTKRILRLMRENELLAVIRAKSPYKNIWKATVEDKISPNLLNREFKSGDVLQKILTDISYLRCKFGFVYLSAAKDSVTNEIVAFNVKDNLGLDLSLDILDELSKLKLATNVMVHSDQGVHYTAKRYRELMEELGLIQSMSRRGNCWDNAPMESFFGHMKDELDFMQYETLEEVQYAVKQYMIYYNQERPQWNLKKMTPVQYKHHLSVI